MSEDSGTDLITSFANPNYSHVSSLLVGSSNCFKEANVDEDYEEENSLLLLKSDDDCEEEEDYAGGGANALSALADAIHSLELLTKGQQNLQQSRLAKDGEYPGFSERLDRSSGCSNDSAFSSPSSESSPPLPRLKKSDGEEKDTKVRTKDSKILVGQDSLQDSHSDNTLKGQEGLCDSPTSNEQEGSESQVIVDLLADDDGDTHDDNNDDGQAEEFSKQQSSDANKEPSEKLGFFSPGWEKCEDASGPYYWHIKTGTIQRHPPDNVQPSSSTEFRNKLTEPDVVAETKSLLAAETTSTEIITPGKPPHVTKAMEPSLVTSSTLLSSSSSTHSSRGSSSIQPSPFHVSGEQPELPVRFAVRSLGWVAVNEEDLTRERSSQTVNRCIVDLSLGGKKDINDSIGKWGDGKYLYMDIDQANLSLIDPIDLTVLNTQAIKSLRVWGVGRENARDFAYVARDRITRAFACHVFRCDQPARHIAATLCHVCKMAIAKRDTLLAAGSSPYSSFSALAGTLNGSRPNRLPNLDGKTGEVLAKYEDLLKNSSFPTPMDEPKKIINCHYLGTIQVSMPTGVEVLNGAIDTLNVRIPPEKWKYVDVTIAPSTITIVEHEFPDNILAECRVRFLSFLGISLKQTKLCAFIMHTAQDNFVAHVFYCEPSAGPLCKTVEAACKLRFQKCLDRKGLSAANADLGLHQSQSGTIKPDTEGCDEENRRKAHAFLLSNLSSDVLQRAKSGFAKSASTIKGGLVRASSLVSESADNIKQSLSSLGVRDNLNSSATFVKEVFSDGAKVTKNGFSVTVQYLKKKKNSLIMPIGVKSEPAECHQSFHREEKEISGEELMTSLSSSSPENVNDIGIFKTLK